MKINQNQRNERQESTEINLLLKTTIEVKASIHNYFHWRLCDSKTDFHIRNSIPLDLLTANHQTSVHDSKKFLFIYDLNRRRITFQLTPKLKIKSIQFCRSSNWVLPCPFYICWKINKDCYFRYRSTLQVLCIKLAEFKKMRLLSISNHSNVIANKVANLVAKEKYTYAELTVGIIKSFIWDMIHYKNRNAHQKCCNATEGGRVEGCNYKPSSI